MHSKCVEMHSNANFIKPGFPKEGHIFKRQSFKHCLLRALSFCQNWPAKPVGLQTKCNNLKEHLHDNPSHCSGGVYIIFRACYIEGVVKLFLLNAQSGRSVLSNGKRP